MGDVFSLVEVKKVLADAYEVAKTKEVEERADGKVLQDNPVARQMAPCERARAVVPDTKFIEAISLRQGKHCSAAVLATGTTSYLESRRLWGVYAKVLERYPMLSHVPMFAYTVFHFVPGVMAIIRNPEDQVLMCVRSQLLAGTHTGMLSFPAGLMKPGELVQDALLRKVEEETGITRKTVERGNPPLTNSAMFVTRNPDAPQDVYCMELRLRYRGVKISETWEAQGNRYVWVDWIAALLALKANKTEGVVQEFKKAGIDIPETVQFAPDARAAAEEFLPTR